MNYAKHYNREVTQLDQEDPLQVPNNAGGFSFTIDDWSKLERFLIIGSEGGTYYVSERKLTVDNAKAIDNLISIDGKRVVDTVVAVSEGGKAPKNDPALFVLAMAASNENKATRRYALSNLDRVARTGTHLFTFVSYVNEMRGWGRLLREAIKNWYQKKDADNLAYQVAKYQSRNKWSHRDLLRLVKPVPEDAGHQNVYAWAANKRERMDMLTTPDIIVGYEKAKNENNADPNVIANLIREYRLTREMVPTESLNYPVVWEALLERMPMTAMIRNLGNLTKHGIVAEGSEGASKVIDALNVVNIRRARVHPLQILVAISTYSRGQGFRGTGEWTPVESVVKALDDAFYMAFDNVEPTGKRILTALDVSSSMGWGTIAGMGSITPAEGAAAMLMVTARSEENCHFMAFAQGLSKLKITKNMNLDRVIQATRLGTFGGTDCAQPMLYALEKKLKIDTFIVYTDNETWAGSIHPHVALQKYRDKMGIPAKLIVVGMEANYFTIADPNDPGMLDVVGFSTDSPAVISSFIADKF